MAKKLVIVGGGHASMPLVKMGKKWQSYGIEITLISENPYLIYSGALPQFMGGFYDWAQTAIDLRKLAENYSVKFIQSRIEAIDEQEMRVYSKEGQAYSFDYLVINVGAETAKFASQDDVVPVKPMNQLVTLRNDLKSGKIKSLLIAGGGAAGAELALNITHPLSFCAPKITLLESGERLLSGFPHRLSEKVHTQLLDRSVDVKVNTPYESGMADNFDAVLVAVGNRPVSENITHTLAEGAGGRILTDRTLRVQGSEQIFAAGDTADVGGENYRAIGVHAVKQGVVLRQNIMSLLKGSALQEYKPYPAHPLIISNGPDHAFFVLRRIMFDGRWAAILKHILDMNWLEKYTLPEDDRRSYSKLLMAGVDRTQRKYTAS